MNILFISNRKQSEAETDFLCNAFLRRNDIKLTILHAHSEKPLSVFEKFLYKIRLPNDVLKINERMVSLARGNAYDLILIIKGNKIRPQTLRRIKSFSPNILIFGHTMDNIFKSHNSSYYLHAALNKLYDAFFLKNCPNYKAASAKFKCDFQFQDMAYDRLLHRNISIPVAYEILFVGSYEKQRFESMVMLAKAGFKVDVFGNSWPNKTKSAHPLLLIHGYELVGEDYVSAVNSAKININFLRKMNDDTFNSRAIELPACGVFCLLEWSQRQAEIFEDGEDVVFFSSDEQLLSSVTSYLKKDKYREKLANNVLQKIKKHRLTFDDRVDEIIQLVSKLRGGP